jgi:hypothetical protein
LIEEVEGEIGIVSIRRRHEETQQRIWPNSKGFGMEMQNIPKSTIP